MEDVEPSDVPLPLPGHASRRPKERPRKRTPATPRVRPRTSGDTVTIEQLRNRLVIETDRATNIWIQPATQRRAAPARGRKKGRRWSTEAKVAVGGLVVVLVVLTAAMVKPDAVRIATDLVRAVEKLAAVFVPKAAS